jgi:hypothetical protein
MGMTVRAVRETLKALRAVAIAAVVFGLAAPAAHAEPLTPGGWLFQSNYGGGKSRVMRMDIEVGDLNAPNGIAPEGWRAAVKTITGATRAKCSKFSGPGSVSYTVKDPQQLVIREDGSFAGGWMKLVSIGGYTGTIKMKGTVNSERVVGHLWLRMKIRALGSCSVDERFRISLLAH